MRDKGLTESQILHQRAVSLSKQVQPAKEDTTQFIYFNIGNELYGISIASVTAVLAFKSVCWLPGLSSPIIGIFNRRGEFVSVIDFKAFLGFSSTEKSKDCCLIVVKNEEMETALLVEKMAGVLDIETKKIQPPPPVLNKGEAKYVQGEIKIDEGLLIILSVNNILTFLGAQKFEV